MSSSLKLPYSRTFIATWYQEGSRSQAKCVCAYNLKQAHTLASLWGRAHGFGAPTYLHREGILIPDVAKGFEEIGA